MSDLPKILVVLGPTASGKSSLAFKLAKEYNGELVSADSRQIYRHMDIGTAKDIGEWIGGRYIVGGVPLHLVDFLDPKEEYSAAVYQQDAFRAIDDILKRGKLPIVVGGTGLYAQAIVDNPKIPEVPPQLEIREELKNKSLAELQTEYRRLDPEGYELIDENNPVRLIRAIEVCRATGGKFSELLKNNPPKYEALQIGLAWPREDLYKRIDGRVDQMVEQGLFDEAKRLVEQGYSCELQAMNGIGYAESCRFLRGEIGREEAISLIKKNTRHYAKRQMSWFKRDDRIHWIRHGGYQAAKDAAKGFIKES